MEEIIEDVLKIYISCINSYEARFHQVLNNRFTLVDKGMLTAYLYIKIIEDKQMHNDDATNALLNYLMKQVIYSETGNISIEVPNDKLKLCNKILDEVIQEKFDYKNRIMRKLKYEYIVLNDNPYNELLSFLEIVAEYVLLEKILSENNMQAKSLFDNKKDLIIGYLDLLNKKDLFYDIKKDVINLVSDEKLNESEYGQLMFVALSIKNVYRFSNSGIISKPENVLFHSYTIAIITTLLAKYCNQELHENFDIYKVIVISLFHDFTEYKGTEIVTPFKNYNDITRKLFSEIENSDKENLIEIIGPNLGYYLSLIKTTKEGYISELIDKLAPIMRIWFEIGYIHNYTFISLAHTIYQERLKRFLRIKELDDIKNKDFLIGFLRECYIYTKEKSIEADTEYTLKYYTQDELDEFRKEIQLLKNKPERFLM